MNVSLLQDTNYLGLIKQTILTAKTDAKNLINKDLVWDYIKCKIRTDTITYSISKHKEQNKIIDVISAKLEALENLVTSTPDLNSVNEYNQVKKELEELYENKVKGAMVRSRCNMLENNEKPSKFFLNLEKAKNNIRSIKSLKINNKLIFSQTEILEHQKNFYSSLYSNSGNGINNEDLSAYLDKISIPQISNSTKIICDDELTLEEIHKAVKSLALNKTPGIDGLPVEFYRVFWEDIKDILLSTYKNSFRKGLLTTSQRQGIINLIPKKDKDLTELKSWRPLSILNTDYKI